MKSTAKTVYECGHQKEGVRNIREDNSLKFISCVKVRRHWVGGLTHNNMRSEISQMITNKRTSMRQSCPQCERLQRSLGETGDKRSYFSSLCSSFIFLPLSTTDLFLNYHFSYQRLGQSKPLLMVYICDIEIHMWLKISFCECYYAFSVQWD